MNVYRYLEKEYVENFFDTGSLMLSSFERCRRHEDARADAREGKSNFLIRTPGHALAGMQHGGHRTLLLCASRILSDHLRTKFDVDSQFKLARPLHFTAAIAECLDDVKGFRLGDVSYADNGIETSHPVALSDLMPSPSRLRELSSEELETQVESMQRTLSDLVDSTIGNDSLFVKRQSYADEAEFRFCWTISKAVNDSTIITCPEAVKYCRRE